MNKPNKTTQVADQDELDRIEAQESYSSPDIIYIEDLKDFLG